MELNPEVWNGKRYEELVEELTAAAEPKYKAFQESLIPGADHLLGVRMPQLRSIAKQIAKGDWRGFLRIAADDSFEEILLQGMVIGNANAALGEKLERIEAYVPKIANWAVCDGFCSGLKFSEEERERVFGFLERFFASRDEYSIRFGVVMLLHYIEPKYIDRILQLLGEVRHESYYVRMAAAWVLSDCYIRFPEKTMEFLQSGAVDEFIYGKTLQKIIESKRIDEKDRERIRGLRKTTFSK